MATDIDKFVHDQLSVWPAVAAKYRALKSARTRTLKMDGILVTLQSNPGRLPIFDHGCPLCEENYLERQHTLPFEGRKGRKKTTSLDIIFQQTYQPLLFFYA